MKLSIRESFNTKPEVQKLMIREKISENDYSQSVTGQAYKVFRVKDGKLYPPMVANKGGSDTPVGVWLDAEEGEFAGLSVTGKEQVKSTQGGTLAYRPGWHLGDLPRAQQFDRGATRDPMYDDEGNPVMNKSGSKQRTVKSGGKFPEDFIWALCDYVMDIDYQGEAHQAGLSQKDVRFEKLNDEIDADGTTYHILRLKNGSNTFNLTYSDDGDIRVDGYPFANLEKDYKYLSTGQKEILDYVLSDNQDALANIINGSQKKGKAPLNMFAHISGDLKHLPTGGYYRYRTNPDPETVPWVITGAMKVTKLLGDDEVNSILRKNGVAPVDRVGGNKTVDEIMQDSFKVTNVKFVPKSKTELDVTYSGENIGEIYRPEGSNEFEVDLNFKGKKYSGTAKNAAEAKKLAKSAFMELVKQIKF